VLYGEGWYVARVLVARIRDKLNDEVEPLVAPSSDIDTDFIFGPQWDFFDVVEVSRTESEPSFSLQHGGKACDCSSHTCIVQVLWNGIKIKESVAEQHRRRI
jgi:hypothetical protein